MHSIHRWDQIADNHIIMTKMTYPCTEKKFSFHWHTVYEILRPMQGRICVWLNGSMQWLGTGDCILISPGSVHDLITDTVDTAVQVIQFIVPDSMLTGWEEDSLLYLWLYMGYNDNMKRIIRADDRFSAQTAFLCEEICRTVQAEEPIAADLVKGAVRMLLSYFLIGIQDRICRKNDKTFDMMKIYAYIDERDTASLTMAEVSAYMGYSAKYFSEKFKQITGIGFKEYLDQVRMLEARKLLGEGKSATEISGMLGYSCVQNFSRAFKRFHHVSLRDMTRSLRIIQ